MTREEAIHVLKQELGYLGGGPSPNIHEYEDALAAAIAALQEQDVTDINVGNKWISVEERLPDDTLYGKNILICIKNRWGEQRVDTVHWWGLEQRLQSAWFWVDVTHWMPLPEPPKEEV